MLRCLIQLATGPSSTHTTSDAMLPNQLGLGYFSYVPTLCCPPMVLLEAVSPSTILR